MGGTHGLVLLFIEGVMSKRELFLPSGGVPLFRIEPALVERQRQGVPNPVVLLPRPSDATRTETAHGGDLVEVDRVGEHGSLRTRRLHEYPACLLYTSDAADDLLCV